MRRSPALEGKKVALGPRQKTYGHPYESFTRIGEGWGAILGTGPIPPWKVALCMIVMKAVRESFSRHYDNLVDIVGYTEALNLVYERLDE
jgi:hypothetical protein